MTADPRLHDYPYVVVRIACRDCPRVGRYRLAALAEKFGAEARLVDVLEAIAASCDRNNEKQWDRRCQVFLPDLVAPRPPDMPKAATRCLHLVKGGNF